MSAAKFNKGDRVRYQTRTMFEPKEGVFSHRVEFGYELEDGAMVPFSAHIVPVEATGGAEGPAKPAGSAKRPGVGASKVCAECGKDFAPRSNVQKRCDPCRVVVQKRRWREHKAKKSALAKAGADALADAKKLDTPPPPPPSATPSASPSPTIPPVPELPTVSDAAGLLNRMRIFNNEPLDAVDCIEKARKLVALLEE